MKSKIEEAVIHVSIPDCNPTKWWNNFIVGALTASIIWTAAVLIV